MLAILPSQGVLPKVLQAGSPKGQLLPAPPLPGHPCALQITSAATGLKAGLLAPSSSLLPQQCVRVRLGVSLSAAVRPNIDTKSSLPDRI